MHCSFNGHLQVEPPVEGQAREGRCLQRATMGAWGTQKALEN